MLVEAGVLDARHAPLERPPKRVVGRACCRGAYLRGALLGGGSLSGPRVAASRAPHDLARGRRVPPLRRRGRRRDGWASSTAAATPSPTRRASTRSKSVLSAAGATDTVLAFEERSIVAAARGEANRLANADHANLVRTSRAAQEQLEAVRALQGDGRPRAAAGPAVRGRPPPAPAIRSCRCASSRRSATRRRRKASVHRRLKKLQELAYAKLISGAKRPFRVLARIGIPLRADSDPVPPQNQRSAGRRGSSEDDLPLRVPCSGADAERGLNSTTDEHGPALPRLRHQLSCVTPHSFSAKATMRRRLTRNGRLRGRWRQPSQA